MILVDAYNIVSGGGKTLLTYLVANLSRRSVPHKILSREDWKIHFKKKNGFFNTDITKRKILLKKYIFELNPKVLLCFGNYPPPLKISTIPIITYFQNALLLTHSSLEWFSATEKLKFYLKRKYFKNYIANSNYFVLQTEVMKKRFIDCYDIESKFCKVYPYYDKQKILNLESREEGNNNLYDFIYASSSAPHKNHNLLLDCWERLLSTNLAPTLVLTISNNIKLTKRIDEINNAGGNIINIGHIPHNELLRYVRNSRFTIFPSFEETLGLGIIEGSLLGNKVLVSNLEYWKDILVPSGTFDPRSLESILDCVSNALHDNLNESHVLISDQINNFIDFMIEENER